jgi:NTE family protein
MDVSLALGGGGVKGLAHIGVIASLEAAGVHVRAIAGTSVGSLVGALYASGMRPERMASMMRNTAPQRLFSRLPEDGPSLLGFGGIAQILSRELGNLRFGDLKIPFACTSVDVNSATEVILMDGPIVDAVLASSAVPGVFPARQHGDALLVDGAVLDPVPVSTARWLAPSLPVVASVLSPEPSGWGGDAPIRLPYSNSLPGRVIEQISRMRYAQAFNIFVQSMDITSHMLTELRLEIDRPEVIIRPDLSAYSMLQDVAPDELIQIGREAADDMMPVLRNANSWRGQISRRIRRVSPPFGLVDDSQ